MEEEVLSTHYVLPPIQASRVDEIT